MITDKLKIVNPTAHGLGEMFGISPERQNEIAGKLDEMVKLPKETRLVYASSIIDYLETHCETKEELFYAFMNHMYWLLLQNRCLPPSLAEEYKKKYPVDDLKNM